jgi:hypothetical protein
MDTRERRHIGRKAGCLENCPKTVSEEKIQGLLENIFGLKVTHNKAERQTVDEGKFADMLTNIFGVKLPSELIPNAYTIFMHEQTHQ